MRARSRSSWLAAVTALIGLTGFALAAPAAAVAAENQTQPSQAECTISDATITWGFKEGFRSYLGSSIARGSWEAVDGATYQTPNFEFHAGTGTYDPVTQTGEVAFAGGVNFTGHEGLLDTRISNPKLVFSGPGVAVLHLDVSGVLMEEAIAGKTDVHTDADVPFVDLVLPEAAGGSVDGVLAVEFIAATTTLTAEGSQAFPNYPAGESFDPITVLLAGECATGTAQSAAPTPAPEETVEAVVISAPVDDAGPNLGWIGWAIGALVVLAGATWVGAAVAKRNRKPGAEDSA